MNMHAINIFKKLVKILLVSFFYEKLIISSFIQRFHFQKQFEG